MSDLVTALGLVLVIEGLLWAAFPRQGRALLELVDQLPELTLRRGGVIAMAIGVALVWAVRG